MFCYKYCYLCYPAIYCLNPLNNTNTTNKYIYSVNLLECSEQFMH